MNSSARKRALFLDRDGVINIEKNYVHRIEDFEFIDGIFELCKTAQDLGFHLFVITNQAGIGRGYYTEQEFHQLTEWMLERFGERNINISKVYFCPYHPTAGIGKYRRESFDRKPNPGMLLKAAQEFDLHLPSSILIGDKISDIEAGQAAGIRHNLHLLPKGQSASPQEFTSLPEISRWLTRYFHDS
jgi:D-glycero-D-manno-heptose 1,7-bisphosphate phosphatase